MSDSATSNPSSDPNKAGAVLLFSAMDDLDDMTLPRLIAAGANPAKIFELSGESPNGSRLINGNSPDVRPDGTWRFQLHRDLQILDEELTRLKSEGNDVRLIVIGSIRSLL